MAERRWRSTATATTSSPTSRARAGCRHRRGGSVSGRMADDPYRVARAAIAAGAHYIDLADDGAFVAGIGALDEEARAAGVAVISGASSVPAISAAALDELVPGLATVAVVGVGDPARQPRAARPVADAHHRRSGRQTAARCGAAEPGARRRRGATSSVSPCRPRAPRRLSAGWPASSARPISCCFPSATAPARRCSTPGWN